MLVNKKLKRGIDFSKLPRKRYGTGTCVDWGAAVGMKVPFCYGHIKGDLEIIEHQRGNYIVLGYEGRRKRMRTNHLAEGKFRDLVFDDNKLVRKIDFSNVPKRNGRNDWVHSVGCVLPFYYDGIEGFLKIIGCKSKNGMFYLTVRYKDRVKDIRNINLLNCKIANVIGYITGDYLFDKGDEIVDEAKSLTILGRKRYESAGIIRKGYQYCCNFCGYIDWTDETALKLSKKVCKHCTKKVVIRGVDDIATEAPWMIKFFQEKDKYLVYECRKTSNKEIYPICPYCGEVRKIKFHMYTIYKLHSIGCPKCSDGVSYPEKFLREVFRQMGIEILFHPTVKDISWTKPHVYDFYDSKRKVIIEVQGMQHYEEVKSFAQSLDDVIANDKIKKEKAIKNGICYIQLDCRYSKKDYIKSSLLNNEGFNRIYELNSKEIDWDLCHEEAMRSMYIKIYEYKLANPNMTNIEIAQYFQVNRGMVSKAILKFKN